MNTEWTIGTGNLRLCLVWSCALKEVRDLSPVLQFCSPVISVSIYGGRINKIELAVPFMEGSLMKLRKRENDFPFLY